MDNPMKNAFVKPLLLVVYALASASAFAVTVTKVTVLSPGARTYEPFTVRADFDEPFCMSTTTPKYSSLKLDGNTLKVQLSHVKADKCVSSHTVDLPGLPAGTYLVQVAITQSRFFGANRETYEASTAETPHTVAPFLAEQIVPAITCDRTMADGTRGFSTAIGCWGGITLPGTIDEPLETDAWSAQPRGAFVFRVIRTSDDPGAQLVTSGLPQAFIQLLSVRYPVPRIGRLFTTSRVECQALASAWGTESYCDGGAWALRLVNGACPLGATRVYRLFHPVAVEHRYTQEEGILPLLVEAGYIVEGAVFCA